MSEFFSSFTKTIGKLWQTQQKDPPAMILEALAEVLRFGLVAICIAAVIFAVQLCIALCVKKQRKTALPFGIVCAVCAAVAIVAFLPLSAAPEAAAESAAVQALHYISTKELAAQEAAAQAESDAASAPAEGEAVPVAADGNTTGGANSDVNSGAGEDDEQEEKNPLLDDTLHRVVATQTELTDEQTTAIAALLEKTQCTRTLRMSLPQENAQNVLLRLENGKRWQILMLEGEGYVYPTEKTGFLCKIKGYDTFYKQLQGIVK